MILAASSKTKDSFFGWFVIFWLLGGVILFVDGIERDRWWEVALGVLMWTLVGLGMAHGRGIV